MRQLRREPGEHPRHAVGAPGGQPPDGRAGPRRPPAPRAPARSARRSRSGSRRRRRPRRRPRRRRRPRAARRRWRRRGRPAGRRAWRPRPRTRRPATHVGGVVAAQHALDHDRQAGQLGEPADVVEGPVRAGDRRRGALPAGWLPSGRSAGRAKSLAHVAQPASEHRQVDGEHQGAVAGPPGPPGQVVGVARGSAARRAGTTSARRLDGGDVGRAGCSPMWTRSSAPRRRPRPGRSPARRRGAPSTGRPRARRRSGCATSLPSREVASCTADAAQHAGPQPPGPPGGGRLARA